MPRFKFNCPCCCGKLEADIEDIGLVCNCPFCNKQIEVKGNQDCGFKKCFYCGTGSSKNDEICRCCGKSFTRSVSDEWDVINVHPSCFGHFILAGLLMFTVYLIPISIIWMLVAFCYSRCTEYVVTNKRVTLKTISSEENISICDIRNVNIKNHVDVEIVSSAGISIVFSNVLKPQDIKEQILKLKDLFDNSRTEFFKKRV